MYPSVKRLTVYKIYKYIFEPLLLDSSMKNCQMHKFYINFDYQNGQELYGIRDESLRVHSGQDVVDFIDVEVKETLLIR